MNKKIVVVNTANRPWSVVDSKDLSIAFLGYEFKEIYYSVSGYKFEGASDDVYSVFSENELVLFLKTFNPDVIYLRVSPHTRSEHLCKIIRDEFFYSKLVVEFYDMSLNFDSNDRSYMNSGDIFREEKAIEGCYSAINDSDLVVLKSGGDAFKKWSDENFKSPYVSYFPNINKDIFESVKEKKRARNIIYAGSLNSREFNEGAGVAPGANVLNYLNSVLLCDNLNLSVVNAIHWSEDEDSSDRHKNIMRWVEINKVDYFRSMSVAKLKKMMLNYDVGMCCSHYFGDKVMDVTRFGVPNRVSTYLSAGLPVLIDESFEYMAGLVKEFGAGVVVPPGNFDYMISSVIDLKLSEAIDGVFEMKEELSEKNISALKCLIETIN